MLVLNFVEKKSVLREHLMLHWDTNKRSVIYSYGILPENLTDRKNTPLGQSIHLHMPCSFTGAKMFCVSPKHFVPHQKMLSIQ